MRSLCLSAGICLAALAATAVTLAPRPAAAAVEDDLRDGDRYFESGEWAKAAAAYDRAIGKAPGQVSAEAYGKRAAIFIILKNYKGGLDFIERAKARYPSAPEILEQEALILWETERKDDAIGVAERVVAARPQSFTNQKLIGEYYATRDPARTALALEAYLQHRPGDLESGDVLPRVRLGFAYLANARAAIAEGDEAKARGLFGKAAEQFNIVQKKHGKRPNAQVNADNGLCAAYTGQGRFDEAVTVCERVTGDPKRIDPAGSGWFNLATAYLARKQTKKARAAAGEFVKLRKTEARGFMLIGDTHFAERDWTAALDQYLRAEKLAKGRPYDQVQLSIRLGKTYRRLPAPQAGANGNLALAIQKLEGAMAGNPASAELAIELGGAYLEARQDAKAAALTERLLAGPVQGAPADVRASLLVVSGKAQFNQRKLKEARQRFEAAQALRPADLRIQRALVLTINEQAFEATKDGAKDGGKDQRAAQALLQQALAIDSNSPITVTNLALLALDSGECDAARKELGRLEAIRGHDAVLHARLEARSFLCGAKPDPKRAATEFAAAEKEARKANATTALAEIYTEWAPLLWDTDPAGAVEKLEAAVQAAGQDPEIGAAAKRNLALALYRRGWKLVRDGKAAEAAADFERALRDPSVLRGNEQPALELSQALAQLEGNRPGDAAKLFKGLTAKGNQAAYLKPPYATVGPQFFAAYAAYRSGTLAGRQQAAAELGKLQPQATGAFADKIRDLIASAWEMVAHEQWRLGQPGLAARTLGLADKLAVGDTKRRIAMDRTALSLGKGDLAALEAFAGNPPEAFINVGIIYDLLGRPKDAYDAWQRARARGVATREVLRWIEAKKRIYGF
ncbi:MAG TPA: tetratricopeptide repeat protein [Kofleriaceae bacterium]|nr:tetratricopeptide repeat protein [Kofleriaceae bacterium]